MKEGRNWVVDIDLAKFFDTINHDRILYRLGIKVTDKRILRIVAILLRSGARVGNHTEPTTEGSIQGSPLSPLLSNIILDELDKELEKRELKFCRWADDCNIYVRSEIAASRVMTSIKKFIETKLKLKVNEEKSKVAKSRFVKFLGMTLMGGAMAISVKNMAKAMEQVRNLTPTNSPIPVQRTMEKVNEWYVGWANYHKMTSYPYQLGKIEAHIRRRLRARMLRQCKHRRAIFYKLVKRGVRRKTAARNAWSNHGPWNLSMKAANTAWSAQWFINATGQKIFSDKKLPHWKHLSITIKLT